jgi:hypothetical protein
MKLERVTFEPKAVLTFTYEEVKALMELSAHHYDARCRSLSVPGPGAVIWALTFGGEIHAEDVESSPLRFRDVDLMAKCCENAGPARNEVGADLYWELHQVLKRLNAEWERVDKARASECEP